MKTYLHPICQSLRRTFRKGFPVILIIATLILTSYEASARGVAVVRGPRGGTAVAVGGGYRGGVAYRGVGYGGVGVAAAGVRGAYIHSIPPGYRMAWYGGYNCYYTGGVYYRATFYQGSTVYVVVP